MDSDRPHRTGSTSSASSELFICFTSRLSSSSSSMKISKSSSIHSPGRSNNQQISLSTSLSRRLRTNGSIKGWQASPMFPSAGNKKRGGAFENPEPSSPKVTCIGQVRVKTKKHRKKLQRRQRGEFSFRKVEIRNQENQNQNHSYQQSICEALRSIGAEFSCLFPCKSSCFSTGESEREKEEKGVGCGTVFGRWLVAMHDEEGEKGREIELVVGGGEEEEEEEEGQLPVRNLRRHVFDNLEIEDLMPKVKKDDEAVEEEEGRVSICVPPKNALLLMRCRSDPMKMADLANRFWEPSVEGDDEEDDYERESVNVKEFEVIDEGSEKRDSVEVNEEQVITEAETKLEIEILVEKEEEEEEMEEKQTVIEEENTLIVSSLQTLADLEVSQSDKENAVEENDVHYIEEESETEEVLEEEEAEEESISEEKRKCTEFDERERESVATAATIVERESKSTVLPDCLLLMMCEPKLSMEVSKETWVCSTDFIRWQPDNKIKQTKGGDEPKEVTADTSDLSNPAHHQPPRSSCSFPAPAPAASKTSMATVIEQKLVSAVGCEPFVLTRCKSAPMRTSSKLVQDSCFWKNRNLEPHRRSSVGLGAAGVGF